MGRPVVCFYKHKAFIQGARAFSKLIFSCDIEITISTSTHSVNIVSHRSVSNKQRENKVKKKIHKVILCSILSALHKEHVKLLDKTKPHYAFFIIRAICIFFNV